MANATELKFGDPDNRIAQGAHWTVLLRPRQPTLGSLVLVCREDVKSFSAVSAAAFADLQRMVGPGHGRAREQQGQGVDQRQVPGRDGLDAGGRPGGPGGADFLDRRQGAVMMEQRHLEEHPEPRHEEHHFRGDEQDHAVAQADRDDRGVVAGLGFLGHVRPPAEHGVEHARDAGGKDGPVALLDAEHAALDPADEADRHDGGRGRTHEGPRAGRKDVVVVFDGAGHVAANPYIPLITVAGPPAPWSL